MKNTSRGGSLVIVLLSYIAAFAACFFCYDFVSSFTGNAILTFFILDIIATLIIWAIGLVFGNASLYDPYWSVVPVVMALFFTITSSAFSAIAMIYLIAFSVWGIRLTVNWIIDWPGLSHQDWRYTMLRDKNPKIYFLTNLFGINLVPTLFVFAAMIPALTAIELASNINFITILGAAVCVGAALLQLIADGQMRRFRHGDNKGKNMQSGLWKYSRHPNYFGEVSFWWGIFLMQVSVIPEYWYLVIGPVLMTILFVFISVPMMKNKLLDSKEGYAEYVRNTSMLIPLPNKNK